MRGGVNGRLVSRFGKPMAWRLTRGGPTQAGWPLAPSDCGCSILASFAGAGTTNPQGCKPGISAEPARVAKSLTDHLLHRSRTRFAKSVSGIAAFDRIRLRLGERCGQRRHSIGRRARGDGTHHQPSRLRIVLVSAISIPRICLRSGIMFT